MLGVRGSGEATLRQFRERRRREVCRRGRESWRCAARDGASPFLLLVFFRWNKPKMADLVHREMAGVRKPNEGWLGPCGFLLASALATDAAAHFFRRDEFLDCFQELEDLMLVRAHGQIRISAQASETLVQTERVQPLLCTLRCDQPKRKIQ